MNQSALMFIICEPMFAMIEIPKKEQCLELHEFVHPKMLYASISPFIAKLNMSFNTYIDAIGNSNVTCVNKQLAI